MKMFTKLALVSSVAISANAMAMQSMDDAALSAATGQDGINIGIGISRIDIDKVIIHDNDGLNYAVDGWTAPAAGEAGYGGVTVSSTAPAVAARAGAIVIKGDGIAAVPATPSTPAVPASVTQNKGIVITANTAALLDSHNLADISIDTEAGAGGGNTAFLNVAAKVSGLNIAIGEIGVSGSGTFDDGSATHVNKGTIRRGTTETTNYNAILSGLTLKTGTMDANIQLGAAPQGAMIILSTTMTGGLEIKNLGIIDNSTVRAAAAAIPANPPSVPVAVPAVAARGAGEIRLDSIKVADASDTDLTINAKVSVVGADSDLAATSPNAKGYLQITTGNTSSPATDIYIKGIHLGSATAGSIGDVEVQGLQTYYGATGTTKGSVITITGH